METGAIFQQSDNTAVVRDRLRGRYKNDSSSKKKKQENKEEILNKLSPEYVSIYRIELNSGRYEILRLNANTNAKQIVTEHPQIFESFDTYAEQYAKEFILEENREEFLDWFNCHNMKKRLRKEEKITYHYQSVNKEGVYCYFEAYAVKGFIDAEEYNIFLAFRNVNSILYKEKAIQERLQHALDEAQLSNEIISSIAKTYQYVSRIDIQMDYYEEIANRAREHMSIKRTGIVSVTNQKLCEERIADAYQNVFLKFVDLKTLSERMKNEETIAIEYRMKDGSWHKLRFIEKKRDENGLLTHVLCVIRSISDEKMKEHELMYQVSEAKKEVTFKTRFLSNMSHDIRTPINGIMGMIELANRYPDDPVMQQKCRDKMMESSKYLVSLVNDILDINKLESGDITDQKIPFDLTEVLHHANTGKQRKAADKNIEYVVDWDHSEINHMHLVGNPIYLDRLLKVIADNAVKFTNPGGSIRVWCTEKHADEKQIVYEFGCADNGIGMSEEFVTHAFDMFAQENETSHSKYEGSGLGLTIAKRLTERMRGEILLQSEKGVGTIVTVTIPFEIGEASSIPKRVTQCADLSVDGMCVLVAEDNDVNMEIVKLMLENSGIYVEYAADGLEAVKKFENSTPGYYDAIFMDIMMPNLNGWDATRKIRSMKREDAENVPIIAISANAFVEDIINSRISGMNEHLTKPLREHKLIKALKDCVGARLKQD